MSRAIRLAPAAMPSGFLGILFAMSMATPIALLVPA
jgi:hypothetical protein